MDANPPQETSWYVAAMEQLVTVVQDLSHARDLDAVTAIVRDAARALTGADGATFVLRDGDQCYYADENAIAPLWKGNRWPMSICVSGWVMLNAQSVIIPDIYNDPRVPVEAYRPTFVKSLAMVPIRRVSPIGAIGNYWARPHQPSAQEVAILQALADTTSVALENAELYGRLHNMVETLQEQQQRITQQHASLQVFTRALAHDLKEPIRTLTAFSDMLQEVDGDPDKRQTYLGYVGDAARRMGTLIDSVGQYTRLDAPGMAKPAPCDLNLVVDDTRENLGRLIAERGARLICDPLPLVEADRAHLTQLFQNLVANAILHNDAPVTVRIGHEIADGQHVFRVSDDGAGVPDNQAEMIFQPFRRLVHRNDASGLGLAICRRIVTLYGGDIRCIANQDGQGATFLFTLPDTTGPVADAAPVATEAACVGEGVPTLANVLIVDDRAPDLEMTEIALFQRPGLRCNLHTARDGREAHRFLTDRPTPVDLILLDINMPDIDGFELLERLRDDAALRGIPVIMCSGSDHEPDQARARELGAVGYLIKPPRFVSFKAILSGQPGLCLLSDATGGIALIQAAA